MIDNNDLKPGQSLQYGSGRKFAYRDITEPAGRILVSCPYFANDPFTLDAWTHDISTATLGMDAEPTGFLNLSIYFNTYDIREFFIFRPLLGQFREYVDISGVPRIYTNDSAKFCNIWFHGIVGRPSGQNKFESHRFDKCYLKTMRMSTPYQNKSILEIVYEFRGQIMNYNLEPIW